jgi:hypothetical protein
MKYFTQTDNSWSQERLKKKSPLGHEKVTLLRLPFGC